MDVTLVTGTDLLEPDVDEPLLVAALEDSGRSVRVAAWNDPDVDWAAGTVTVIRSTWDYHHDRPGFLDWARRAGAVTGLLNPLRAVIPNTHKSYLAALQRAGLPVVPTRWFPTGGATDPAAALMDSGWERVVVKPAVSGASFGTLAFDLRKGQTELDAAVGHIAQLRVTRDVMVQPYVADVDAQDGGERSVVWIAGELTHAVRKQARFGSDDEHVSAAAIAIADDEAALAERALWQWGRLGWGAVNELLYARIDLVRDPDGAPQLMELELAEPSLFLSQHPPALQRLVDALEMHVGVAARR